MILGPLDFLAYFSVRIEFVHPLVPPCLSRDLRFIWGKGETRECENGTKGHLLGALEGIELQRNAWNLSAC
jgi:hypothetical protein